MRGSLLRGSVTTIGLIGLWELLVLVTGAPRFILPGPLSVFVALWDNLALIADHATTTMWEIAAGLFLGVVMGSLTAILLASFRSASRWLMPVLVVSQAVPVFALAPILVLWLGYGIASKIAMATLVIYFPVTTTLFDGLRRADPGQLDLARVMGASSWATLRHIRLPAALPALATGVRTATAVAPIGAVIGEWVGASRGLGYLMLHAGARMRTDLLFAALLVLAVFAVGLYVAVDAGLRRALPWQPDSHPFDTKE